MSINDETMTTNTDKLAAHMALVEEYSKCTSVPLTLDSVQRAVETWSAIEASARALEAAGRVQQAEPVAVLRFQRNTPGHENDMPAVVSCNWLPDGDYRVYLATPAERAPAPTAPWENFPAYLIDHCEGDTISEEGLQRALSAMLKDQKYAAPTAQEASKPVQAEAAHSDLMKFYGADNLSALVEAQHRHIEKLQANLPRNDQPAFTRVREG